MSSALVPASITALLKNLLENGLVDHGVTSTVGSDTIVSALPPDRIATGSEEKAQINLFLYQAATKGLYSSSRHARSDDPAPRQGLPMAMELQYLVTAYGAQDYQTEILLGYALEVVHKTSDLSGDAIRETLKALSSTKGGRIVAPMLAALASPELGRRFRSLKITPQTLDTQQMQNLWGSFQVCYRPSIALKVAVELSDDREA